MKIALFGASGTIGQRIQREALGRGYSVTAIVRDRSRVLGQDPRLVVEEGNILDAESVAEKVAGHDAVVSAFGPGASQRAETVVESIHSLIAGLTKAGVKRLVVVGGAGSLEVAPGVRLVDSPEFPPAWKGIALAHADALGALRKEGDVVEWTYLSPAALIEPGERTGTFRLGGDQFFTDAQGQSRISAEDYAVALVDELEKRQHVRGRFTVAY